MPSSASMRDNEGTYRPLTNTRRGQVRSPKRNGVRWPAVTAPVGARMASNVDSAIGAGFVKCQSSLRIVGKPAAWKLAMARSRTCDNHAGPSGRAVENCSRNAVLTSGSRSLLGGHPVVAAFLELQRQLLSARTGNAPVDQHMNMIGHDVIEQPLIVRHDKERVVLAAQLVHAVRH